MPTRRLERHEGAQAGEILVAEEAERLAGDPQAGEAFDLDPRRDVHRHAPGATAGEGIPNIEPPAQAVETPARELGSGILLEENIRRTPPARHCGDELADGVLAVEHDGRRAGGAKGGADADDGNGGGAPKADEAPEAEMHGTINPEDAVHASAKQALPHGVGLGGGRAAARDDQLLAGGEGGGFEVVEQDAEGGIAEVGNDDAERVGATAEKRPGENVRAVAEANGFATDASRQRGIEAELALSPPQGGGDGRLRDAEAPRELHLGNHLLLGNSIGYEWQPPFYVS